MKEKMRQLFDWILAAALLCIFAPLMAAIAVMVKLDSPGNIIFCGVRVGKGGKKFRIFKFRTMHCHQPAESPITVKDDLRITRSGRILRKYKLDELPQLVNILRGEMCFVGPRPEDPRFVAVYDEEQKELLNVLPGLTSPGSLHFQDEASLLQGEDWENIYRREILPQKLRMDLEYIAQSSFWSDLKVLAQTLGLWLTARD